MMKQPKIKRIYDYSCFLCGKGLDSIDQYGKISISFTDQKKLNMKYGAGYMLVYCMQCFEGIAGKEYIEVLKNNGDLCKP